VKYVYPAIFELADEGGYAVSFPDLPGCYSQGNSLYEAFAMAQSALTQWIEYLRSKQQPVPNPSNINDVLSENAEFVNLVCAEPKDGRAIKRTVSIPRWMDEKVSETGLSLSRVLQDALTQRLQ